MDVDDVGRSNGCRRGEFACSHHSLYSVDGGFFRPLLGAATELDSEPADLVDQCQREVGADISEHPDGVDESSIRTASWEMGEPGVEVQPGQGAPEFVE